MKRQLKPNSARGRVRPVVALCAVFFPKTKKYSAAEEKTACAEHSAVCQIVQFANGPGLFDRPGSVEKKQEKAVGSLHPPRPTADGNADRGTPIFARVLASAC